MVALGVFLIGAAAVCVAAVVLAWCERKWPGDE